MMSRKATILVLALAAACLALTACMNNGAANVQPTPGATDNLAPGATNVPGDMSDANGNGANNAAGTNNAAGANNTGATGNTAATTGDAAAPFDWLSGVGSVEKAIGQISEVSDARVLVTNSTALVGVRFDGAYKGEMTERIREMVAAEVLRADPSIQTVAVTANDEDVKKVYDLSEQIRAGRTADELSADINSIVRNATTLR